MRPRKEQSDGSKGSAKDAANDISSEETPSAQLLSAISFSNLFEIYFDEFKRLNKMIPFSLLLYVSEYGVFLVFIAMLGHLGKGHQASGFLGFAYYNIIWFFLEGLLTAQDILTARAMAFNRVEACRYWTYISFIVVSIVLLIASILLSSSPWVFRLILNGIDQHIIYKAGQLASMLIPALWLQAYHKVLQKYLHSKMMLLPSLVSAITGIGISIVVNYFLMHICGLGFISCSIVYFLARLSMLAVLGHYLKESIEFEEIKTQLLEIYESIISGSSLLRIERSEDENSSEQLLNNESSEIELQNMGSKKNREINQYVENSEVDNDSKSLLPGVSSKSNDLEYDFDNDGEDSSQHQFITLRHSTINLTYRNLRETLLVGIVRFLMIGIPGGIVLGVESWLFDIVCFVVVQRGNIALDTYSIMIAINYLFYLMIPFSLSIAGSIRISNLLAQNRQQKAIYVARICIVECLLFSLVAAGIIYLSLKYYVFGFLFSRDPDIRQRLSMMAHIASLFQIMFGLQAGANSVLRGISAQNDLLAYSITALWISSLPVSIYLCFYARPKFDLLGIWIGLLVGMGLLDIVTITHIFFIDWSKRKRKILSRLNKVSALNLHSDIKTMDSFHRQGQLILGRVRATVLDDIGVTFLGSRSLGGFHAALHSTLDEELDELEFVEQI